MHVLYLNRSPVEYTKSSVCATNKESLYGGDSLVFEIVYPYVCSYHNSKFKPEGTLMFDNFICHYFPGFCLIFHFPPLLSFE